MEDSQLAITLGRIEGKQELILARQTEQGEVLRAMDGRLRHVETKAATQGAVSGAIVALVMSVGVAMAKSRLGMN